MMLSGLITLAARAGNDDAAAIDEMVSLAWERIRTYPCRRTSSVATNILLDVRKRYRRHRCIEVPESIELGGDPVDGAAAVEDQVLGHLLIDELARAQRSGLMSRPVLATILRTHLLDESLSDLAAEHDVTPQPLRLLIFAAVAGVGSVVAGSSAAADGATTPAAGARRVCVHRRQRQPTDSTVPHGGGGSGGGGGEQQCHWNVVIEDDFQFGIYDVDTLETQHSAMGHWLDYFCDGIGAADMDGFSSFPRSPDVGSCR